ncbi:2-phospho-L-lactate guanylyltransferase [Catellatospora coxensis]|uniref:Phosphoenolpyruvate guanylyltransferase n=1 Tax=Catellatospora coxensis TaxID=310354 RepID=A0A8J3KYU1_9ACTN|nr:2-phospho-L-lactate guanylyltransferase [Catellatospora coxensis]GIG07964.1 2-phospho-L-lactate guanylyltransferase [Catellatospora coxensis]
MYAPGVTVLVPLKPLAEAKSRLRGAAAGHEDLVLDLARATVSAALAADGVARVLVVTRDPRATAALRDCGADVLPDEGRDLNDALRRAESAVTGRGSRVVALPADVPALRPAELAEALAGAGRRRAFVPDAAGVGTVLLVAAPGEPLDPRFGPGSAAAHERSGAVRLAGAWPTLRRDVDTADDLAVVRAWGVLRAESTA